MTYRGDLYVGIDIYPHIDPALVTSGAELVHDSNFGDS